MLTHLEPQEPKKVPKTGRAQNTVKRRGFWPYRVVGGWGGGPSLLRRALAGLSYPGARPCLWEVLVGRFLVDFWLMFHVFLVLSTRKNRVICDVIVPLASKKSL